LSLSLYQFGMKIIKQFGFFISWFPHPKLQYYLRHQGEITHLKDFVGTPIWIHASSGELEYAKSVIREIRRHSPQIPVLVTHTSLSSLPQLKKLDVHMIGVLPIDEKVSVETFLNKIQPRAFLVSRTDLWPELILQLKQRKVPAILFSATFATGSRKSSTLASRFLKSTIQNLTQIYFVSRDDQLMCEKIYGPTQGKILGDTRFDQAIFRLQNSPASSLPNYEKLIVAGSTWPEDDQVLLQTVLQLKDKSWKWVWVPHEISGPQIENLKNRLHEMKVKFQLFTEIKNFKSWDDLDIILIDEVGILATLYPLARVSFVGGSFKKQVHSVMEALAAGSPVLVGPFHHNNREALEFKTKSWVVEISSSDEFVKACQKFDLQAIERSQEILSEVKSRCGATQSLISHLKELNPSIFK
jgi:3-deoxy-D-manno-octulosonic-acid transferase